MVEVNPNYTFCTDLESVSNHQAIQRLQTTSLFHHQQFNAMLLTIPTGHSIKEHLSPKMLTLQIISGTGSVKIRSDLIKVQRGAWFYIAPNEPHEIISDETLIILLSLYTLTDTGVMINE